MHAARRVIGGHVQRLEVVPVGLDLRALGDLEAEPDEHVLEPLPRLGDEVGVPATWSGHDLGEVESLGLECGTPLGCGELGRRAIQALGIAAVASLTAWPAACFSSTVASPRAAS